MPGCWISDAARASLKKRPTTSFDRLSSGSRNFIAARRAMYLCSARYTSPIPPTPSRASNL